MLGAPYTTKMFEYTTSVGEEINDSEGYLVRLSRARKNYLSNWAYTPYFYTKITNWYKTQLLTDTLYNNNLLPVTKQEIKTASLLWDGKLLNSKISTYVTPAPSGDVTPGRSDHQALNNIASNTNNTNAFIDIMTKREYLYREYLRERNPGVTLPQHFLTTPNNKLLLDIQAGYPLVDPTTFGSEISRELFYNNSTFLKSTIIRNALLNVDVDLSILGISNRRLSNFLFYYILSSPENESLRSNTTLYKNQYRPMRKGVTNMIRLHTTGAIALPIEVRMHILASSKDVIHS